MLGGHPRGIKAHAVCARHEKGVRERGPTGRTLQKNRTRQRGENPATQSQPLIGPAPWIGLNWNQKNSMGQWENLT